MNLEQYKSLANDHWKEFLPTYYKALLTTKKLPEALERAAKQTDEEMRNALDSGVPRDQAWEQIRGALCTAGAGIGQRRRVRPEPEPTVLQLGEGNQRRDTENIR